MNTTSNIDPLLCIAWSIGNAVLIALVDHTAMNAEVTYNSIRLSLVSGKSGRWVGCCKTCRKAHRVDGVIATGRTSKQNEEIVISGARCYRTADHGGNPYALFVSCCVTRVKLQRVYDDAKPGKPRHECNAKCLASTGPACECKCKGANHGSSAVAA